MPQSTVPSSFRPNSTTLLSASALSPPNAERIPTVVVIGAGYGGLLCANRLASKLGRRAKIVLVNADASFRERVRDDFVLRHQPPRERRLSTLIHANVELVVARATAVDRVRKMVATSEGDLSYSHLVLATGSRTASPFDGAHDDAAVLDGPGAAAIAVELRRPECETVAVVGGGATAVEIAGSIAAIPGKRVVLVTGGNLVSGLTERLRTKVERGLDRLGVEVRPERVVRVRTTAGTKRIETVAGNIVADLVINATGLVANPMAREMGLATDRSGRANIDEMLRSVDDDCIWGVGDAACAPGISMGCKTAMPMGAHVADNIVALLRHRPVKAFAFADLASFISLGPRAGVLQVKTPFGVVVAGGRFGAAAKAFINAFAFWGAVGERWRMRYRWPQSSSSTARPPRLERKGAR